jgi:hydroxymethylpyrimidine/phosphomethylpyrimidine kinase
VGSWNRVWTPLAASHPAGLRAFASFRSSQRWFPSRQAAQAGGCAVAYREAPNAAAPPRPRRKDPVTSPPPPIALSIAGSDSGGGAGIQADLKTFHQLGVYGTSALTLVTAQNTVGVQRVDLLPAAAVAAQIEAVVQDLRPAAVKTGALGAAAVVEAVAEAAARHDLRPLVVDPVMISKHGDPLLAADAVEALRRALLPRATLLTPNLPEAAALLGGGALEREADREGAARALAALGPAAVLVKGGHGSGPEVADLLYADGECLWLRAPRIETRHTHGTGCSYSAAITARLARGDGLAAAVRSAHAWLARAIATAPGLGSGHGPVNHWA